VLLFCDNHSLTFKLVFKLPLKEYDVKDF
jgi:hypothetical protein